MMKKTKVIFAAVVCLLLMTLGVGLAAPASKAQSPLNVTLNVSMPEKVSGTTAVMQANVKGGSGSYEYKYVWFRTGTKDWDVIQDFSTNLRASHKITKAGNYQITVDVKDTKTGKITSASRKFIINSGWTPLLSVNAPSTKPGTTINAKANAKGIEGNYQFKFVLSRDNWKDFKVISDFSSNNQMSESINRAGKYDLYVDIKDSYGNIQTIKKSFTIEREWNVSLNLNALNSVVDQHKNGLITATANVSGKGEGLEYKFVWSKNNWQDWGPIQQFGKNNKISWSTRTAGNYDIFVDVRDKHGNVVTISKSFKITTPWSIPAPSLSIKTLMPGQKMSISAQTKGNIHGARYKFVWSYNNWKDWGVIQDFGGKKNASFTPKKSGVYDIIVDVRDSKGNIQSSSSRMNISGKYKLMVNLKTQVVTALAQNSDGSYTHVVRNMVCSTGKVPGSTPSGTFKLSNQYRWHTLMGGVWGQWCSRIVGGILFHSVPYQSPNNRTLVTRYYNNLGSPASAGCIRLAAADSKWIFDNCPPGTEVQIGNFNNSYLPGKIGARRIKSSTNWDPTDPTMGSLIGKGYQ